MTNASYRLLVVDDNEMNRDMLLRRLGRQGYTVAAAEDGHQALEMLRTQPFDLVILDLMMPDMNGYQMLEYLKADETLRDIPVIITSALDEQEGRARSLALGAEDYLPKPFDMSTVRIRISTCLEKKRPKQAE